jgi:hypothetical protein
MTSLSNAAISTRGFQPSLTNRARYALKALSVLDSTAPLYHHRKEAAMDDASRQLLDDVRQRLSVAENEIKQLRADDNNIRQAVSCNAERTEEGFSDNRTAIAACNVRIDRLQPRPKCRRFKLPPLSSAPIAVVSMHVRRFGTLLVRMANRLDPIPF